jgi:HAMP domain-containing protein
MNAYTRRRMSRASRALDFAQAHPVDADGFATVVARLAATVDQANQIMLQENSGQTGERSAIAQRVALQTTIRRTQLERLARVGELAAETHPELLGKFVLPRTGAPHKVFLVATRSLMAAALPAKDVLIPLGLGAAFFDDLTKAADALDATTGTAHEGRTDHVVANAGLSVLARACRRDIDILGTFYKAALPADSDLLAAWRSARNLAGPFRHSTPTPEPPAPGGATR